MGGRGKRWVLIRNKGRSFVYLTIDGREEGRKKEIRARFQFNCFSWLSWLEFGHIAFLDYVPCVAGYLRETAGNNKGNGDGRDRKSVV